MSQEVRVGVIGTGMMGGDHARNLSNGIKGARLVGLADACTERVQALAADRSTPGRSTPSSSRPPTRPTPHW